MKTRLLTLLLSLAPAALVAQMSVNALVISGPIALTPLRDLAFGAVLRGVATTVTPTAANAAAVQATGTANAFATIGFVLPTQLTNIQAAPGSFMPITFANGSASWRRGTNDPNGATGFDPNAGVTGRFGPPPNPTLYIWLGGQVNPAANAKPGIYTGIVVVTLTYL